MYMHLILGLVSKRVIFSMLMQEGELVTKTVSMD